MSHKVRIAVRKVQMVAFTVFCGTTPASFRYCSCSLETSLLTGSVPLNFLYTVGLEQPVALMMYDINCAINTHTVVPILKVLNWTPSTEIAAAVGGRINVHSQ